MLSRHIMTLPPDIRILSHHKNDVANAYNNFTTSNKDMTTANNDFATLYHGYLTVRQLHV